jgi:hypothetical protein
MAKDGIEAVDGPRATYTNVKIKQDNAIRTQDCCDTQQVRHPGNTSPGWTK